MDTLASLTAHLDEDARRHLVNVAENLQLIADLGYGDVALAVHDGDGLVVAADARPMTAVAALASSRVGRRLEPADEPEAYDAFAFRASVIGVRKRTTRGISYMTSARCIAPGDRALGVIVRNVAQQVIEAPGTMERVFMSLADRVMELLESGPIMDIDSKEPFSTIRRAGDGVLEIAGTGVVSYASPNAVNIMRLAGMEGGLRGRLASTLPGGATAIAPVLATPGARAVTIEVAGRVLRYRSIGFAQGALVLVEDITDVRRREQEIRVKEATIREVHHRVKNNLQTIASLLRIQARRTTSDEAARALAEAVERISSMAVVHELLAGATEEAVDFTEVARTIVDMVHRGMADERNVTMRVEGETGLIPASTATSLALVCAELVHNAIEHGLAGRREGVVTVSMRRVGAELVLVIRDDGVGLPAKFDVRASSHLGLAIVRTIVEEDLRGSLTFTTARGTTATITVPVGGEEAA